MSPIKAPPRLPELVKSAFTKARESGDLTFFPTQVADISISSVPFQLRFSPALASKPKGPPKDPAAKPFDPFAYEPRPKLFIADIGPAHYLVLNKFAITQEHFIIATRDFKPQTHVLEQGDLAAALACIEAYGEGKLFVFFNGGEHSGASQPHRHLQLLPVERMKDGLPHGSKWDVLTDRISTAPLTTFAEAVSTAMAPEELYAAYLRLYSKACASVARYQGKELDERDIKQEGEARISYNLAMTSKSLVLCPRLNEGGKIYDGDKEVGFLSLNGTVLAGTALVKSEEEWQALKALPDSLASIVKGIGLPSQEGNKL